LRTQDPWDGGMANSVLDEVDVTIILKAGRFPRYPPSLP
jgi:hypothetical protein